MLKFFRVISFLIILTSASSAIASENILQEYLRAIPDKSVKPFIKNALENIHKVRCDNKKLCDAARSEEFEHPPIDIDAGRAAVAHGTISGLANWCGLDEKRSLLPMINYALHKHKLNTRQVQIMTWIHGRAMGLQIKNFEGMTCPESFKNDLDQQLPKIS